MNGGGQARGVRVSPDAVAAVITMRDADGSLTLRATAGRQVAGASVDDPGVWGNVICVDVDARTLTPATSFNLTISEIRNQNGREIAVRSEIHRGLTMAAGPQNAVAVVNAASVIVQLDQDPAWRALAPVPTGHYSGVVVSAQLAGIAAVNALDVDPGDGAVTTAAPLTAPPATLAAAAAGLQTALRGAFPANRLWARAAVIVAGDRLRVAPGRISPDYALGAVVTIADNARGDLAQRLSLDGAAARANVERHAAVNVAPIGFQDAAVARTVRSAPGAADLRGAHGAHGARTQFYALDDVRAFNMLWIPDGSDLGSNANLASVMSEAIVFCTQKRAMVFIDPFGGTDAIDEAEAWLGEIADAGLRAPNAVAYYPRVRIPDRTDGNRLISLAPSATMAGVWARTDGEVGVWKAPAWVTARLANVIALDHAMTDAENGVINPLGLNGLRSFAAGQRGPGGRARWWAPIFWRRIGNTHRSAARRCSSKASLFDGLQWAVFQPNDASLWTEMPSAVNAFMQGLFRQAAFRGTSPRDACIVKCDAETTAPADVNMGIAAGFVGFAPLRPAQFVVISLQLQISQDA
ncbi:MAG: hypothetical protein ACJA1L_001240 [Paracoccaceae bacterium]